MTEQSHSCAVCGRVLDQVLGLGWQHAAADDPADHLAVPVPRDQIQTMDRCDFCFEDVTTHVVPARDFELPHLPGHMSRGDWAACAECARLIGRNEWGALMSRVVIRWEARNGPMEPLVAAGLRKLHRDLRRNITGPIRPLEPR